VELRGERTLRRAHHVLAWLLHFYVHTLPPTAPILIPLSISRPLLSVCDILKLPPVLTYSDDVLYNWSFISPSDEDGVLDVRQPTAENIMTQTTFTGTRHESEFYLASARIELRGVRALSLMSSIADEAFIGDNVALSRITTYLCALSGVIETLTSTLLAVRDGCDPQVFYDEIRPWFKGEDSAPGARKWVFEGAEEGEEWTRELSGPSAGQSALVHALDVFLGVAAETHGAGLTGQSSSTSESSITAIKTHSKPFLERMQAYMPRHHRAFLSHLASSSTPLRGLVQSQVASGTQPALVEAYNAAVTALKAFRDAHMRVVAIYIVGPARRAAEREAARARDEEMREKGRWLGSEQEGKDGQDGDGLKGTGGTELVRFLKGVRDRTASAVLAPQ
jgi:indoleamine 2,3-dioxygenase